MAYPSLVSRSSPGARVQENSAGSAYHLSIPAGAANQYRLAQLDDYAKLPRSRFPLRSSIQVSLAARVSSTSIPGTWGFGLWNDPFGLSLGLGGNPWRLPALPNAAWFFGASKESYLSFRPERSAAKTKGGKQTNAQSAEQALETNRASTADFTKNVPSSAQRGAYNGFLAQVFRSPKFHPLLLLAGLVLPFSRRKTRQYLGKVIDENGVALSMDVAEWHRYRLDWRKDRVSFEVDEVPVFETDVSPKPPLGLVIWIDNQFAAFTPEGRIRFGVLENPEPAWLEIKDLEVGRNDIPSYQ